MGRDVAQQQAYFWCWWIHQLISIVIAGSTITSEDNTVKPGPGNGPLFTPWGINADGNALIQTSISEQELAAVSNTSIVEYGMGSLIKTMLAACYLLKTQLILFIREGSLHAVGLNDYMGMLVKHFVGQWGNDLDQLVIATQCKIALSRPCKCWQQAGRSCTPCCWWHHHSDLPLFQFGCTCSNLGCKSQVNWPCTGQGVIALGGIDSLSSSGWSSPHQSFDRSARYQAPLPETLIHCSWSSIMPLVVASMGVEQIPGTVGPSLRQAMYGEARLANWEEPGLQKLLFRHLEKCAGLRGPSVVHARPNFLDRHNDLA